MTQDRLLFWEQLEPLIPYSRMHTGRLEAAGQFPKRVQLNPEKPNSRVAWHESEVLAWLKSRPRKHVGNGKQVGRK
jgi:prophage regulatory protein